MKYFALVLLPSFSYSILFRGMSVVHFPPYQSILEMLRESFGCKGYKSS
jgi:hypothetical protein